MDIINLSGFKMHALISFSYVPQCLKLPSSGHLVGVLLEMSKFNGAQGSSYSVRVLWGLAGMGQRAGVLVFSGNHNRVP